MGSGQLTNLPCFTAPGAELELSSLPLPPTFPQQTRHALQAIFHVGRTFALFSIRAKGSLHEDKTVNTSI